MRPLITPNFWHASGISRRRGTESDHEGDRRPKDLFLLEHLAHFKVLLFFITMIASQSRDQLALYYYRSNSLNFGFVRKVRD